MGSRSGRSSTSSLSLWLWRCSMTWVIVSWYSSVPGVRDSSRDSFSFTNCKVYCFELEGLEGSAESCSPDVLRGLCSSISVPSHREIFPSGGTRLSPRPQRGGRFPRWAGAPSGLGCRYFRRLLYIGRSIRTSNGMLTVRYCGVRVSIEFEMGLTSWWSSLMASVSVLVCFDIARDGQCLSAQCRRRRLEVRVAVGGILWKCVCVYQSSSGWWFEVRSTILFLVYRSEWCIDDVMPLPRGKRKVTCTCHRDKNCSACVFHWWASSAMAGCFMSSLLVCFPSQWINPFLKKAIYRFSVENSKHSLTHS